MSRHDIRAKVLGVVLGVALVLTGTVTAWAHANLERAEPPAGVSIETAPAGLKLFFSEVVEGTFSSVRVLDTRREAVDRGDGHVSDYDPRVMEVSLEDNLPDGIYTVVWRTLSAVDGHTVTGSYPLLIGATGNEVPLVVRSSSEAAFAAEAAVARWWLYLSASLVFGALLAWWLVYRPLLGLEFARARAISVQRTRWLVLLAGAALLLGTLYAALAQAASAADVPLWTTVGAPLQEVLTRGRYATIWWLRLALVLMALVLVAWPNRAGLTWPMALFAVAGVLLTSSLTSHAAGLASGSYLALTVDWLHFLGVGAWIGGLTSLLVVLPATLCEQPNGAALRARAVQRFSSLALIAMAVIVASGVFQAWIQDGSVEGLLQTAHGLAVSAKVVLLALVAPLAAYNLFIAKPRLAALAQAEASAAGRAIVAFTWTVRAELALGTLLLAVAAVLTGLANGREDLARRAGVEFQTGPLDRQVNVQGIPVRMQVSPATLGPNRFSVELPTVDVASVERVQYTLTFLDAELGSQPLVLQRQDSAGHVWAVDSLLLTQTGRWQADLLVRRTGEDDLLSTTRLMISGGTSSLPTSVAAAYPLLPSVTASLAAAAALVGAVVILTGILGRRRTWAVPPVALVLVGCFAVVGGMYAYAREETAGLTVDVLSVRDPIPPDERSLSSGRAIFETQCVVCHGSQGRGDGPAAATLEPKPANLRVHMAVGHTDGEIFYRVSVGVPGTAMPAWKARLTEDERWDLLNFLKTLADRNEAIANPEPD